jgi:hypothetical protein
MKHSEEVGCGRQIEVPIGVDRGVRYLTERWSRATIAAARSVRGSATKSDAGQNNE